MDVRVVSTSLLGVRAALTSTLLGSRPAEGSNPVVNCGLLPGPCCALETCGGLGGAICAPVETLTEFALWLGRIREGVLEDPASGPALLGGSAGRKGA